MNTKSNLSLNYCALFVLLICLGRSDNCIYTINGYKYDMTGLSHSIVTHDNYYNGIDWSYSFSPCRNEINIRNFIGMASQINEHNGFTFHLASFDDSAEMRPLLVDADLKTYNYTGNDYVYNSDGLGFQLKWQNGDQCGNGDNNRIFKVNFLCDESTDGAKHLFNSETLTLVEYPSCTYTFTVFTKYACTKYATKVSTSSHSNSNSNSNSNSGSSSSHSSGSNSKSSSNSRSSSGSSSSRSSSSSQSSGSTGGGAAASGHVHGRHGHWSTLTTLFFVGLIGFALYMIIRFIINVKNDPMNDWTDINNIPHIDTWIEIKNNIVNCLNGFAGALNERGDYTPLLTTDGTPRTASNNNNNNNSGGNDVTINTSADFESVGNHVAGNGVAGSPSASKSKTPKSKNKKSKSKNKNKNGKDDDEAMNDEIESMLENIDL